MSSVRLVEVGPRDGLQNEEKILTPALRAQLVQQLAGCGLRHIEAGAFVSPHKLPQMQHTDRVLRLLHKWQVQKKIPPRLSLPCLVPNAQGLQKALSCGVREVAFFASSTESFSQRNINCSIQQSLQRCRELLPLVKKHRLKLRAYLSVAFACPYEGRVPLQRVIKLINALFELGAYEVSVGDTVGRATPGEVKKLLRDAKSLAPKLAMHFHDTYGMGLANVLQALELGVRVFDASVGGLGGCPYAEVKAVKRSGLEAQPTRWAGNVATENVVALLQSFGLAKNINLRQLLRTRTWIEKKLGRSLEARRPYL